jgi:CRP-like cAMP-binding protein
LLLEERPAALRETTPASVTRVLSELFERGPARIGPWALACAVDTVVRLGVVELVPQIAELRTGSRHALVSELAESSLARLGEQGGVDTTPGEGRRMNTIERVLTLKTVEMFSLASEEALADIAAILEEVLAQPGEVIIRQGDVGDSMYIIIEGRVRVFDEERTFARLGERDIFGELALLDPEPRSASIAAERETRLFRLDREAFLELLAGNIEIVRGVLQVLCKRLRRSVQTFGVY